jgi:hypothetical protein
LAKVLLYSASLDERARDEWDLGAYRKFRESALNDLFGVHSLTDDPAAADIIVFIEVGGSGLFAELVRHHPYVKKYREKCFLVDPNDCALPFLPGLYASLRRKYHDPTRTRTGSYLRTDENPYIEFRPLAKEPKYVGCFIGSFENHPMRAALANLPSEDFLIEGRPKGLTLQMHYGGVGPERHEFWSHYADGMAAGAFSLCPRGLGLGSIRLFESMRMGRCPVILSDDWVFPERVDWAACSLTVAEKDVSRLGEILHANLGRAGELGMRARQEWERFYAENVRFHWLAEDCLYLLRARRVREAIAGRKAWLHLFDKGYFRRYLRSKKQVYKQYGRIIL